MIRFCFDGCLHPLRYRSEVFISLERRHTEETMENNDWYERYQQYQQQSRQAQRPVRAKKTVGFGALICCVLITALLAGVAGGFVTSVYLNRSEAALPAAEEPAAAAIVTEKPQLQTTPSSSLIQNAGLSGYSKQQIVEIAAPSVVGIDVKFITQSSGYSWGWGSFGGGSQEASSAGSGVIITSDGYIVTCNHVVENANSILVTLNDDTEYEATIVGTDPRNDLAIIKIETADLIPATLGDSDMLTVGEDVIAIGNHLGELRGTATGGMISALNREVAIDTSNMVLLQHDAAVSPGSSGGGLFNSSGSLIGIVNAKASASNAEGLGFAIPVNSVKQIIDDLINYGYVKGRAYLGVYTQNVTLQSDRGGWGGYFGGYGTSCVQVAQVIKGCAAEQAGIRANDLILAVGDVQITSNDVLSDAIGEYNVGDKAKLTIQRDGKQMEIEVTFGEYMPET